MDNLQKFTLTTKMWLRFWHKVDKNGPIPTHRPDLGPCWQWIGRFCLGYGRFEPIDRVSVRAHRFSYWFCVGPIPEELEPDHLCRNRGCVHPGHVELVTSKENTLRGNGPTGVNGRKTHCVNGHLFAGENLRYSMHSRYPNHPERVCRTCRRNRRQATARKQQETL